MFSLELFMQFFAAKQSDAQLMLTTTPKNYSFFELSLHFHQHKYGYNMYQTFLDHFHNIPKAMSDLLLVDSHYSLFSMLLIASSYLYLSLGVHYLRPTTKKPCICSLLFLRKMAWVCRVMSSCLGLFKATLHIINQVFLNVR